MKNSSSVERGYPLLADISGFVPFVTESEIDHASEIVQELLEFVVKRLEPTFTITQIDGDAIFAYAPQAHLARGETLLELLESTYTAYKDQLLQVSRVRTCGCNACRNAPKLDLKFAVHFGEYIPHEIHSQFDLLGLAPLFIRKREWKAPVKESTDWRGYALFTQDCLTELGVHPDDLRAAEIPGGSVRSFGLNLESRYNSLVEYRRVVVTEEDALHSFSQEFPVHAKALWDWINDPDKRTMWYILRWSARARPGGRTGTDAVNHCNHGIGDTLEKILDWRPFEYYTAEFQVRPFNIRMQQTMALDPITDNETQLRVRIKPAEESAGGATRLVCWMFARYERFALRRLKRLIESGNLR